MTIFEDIGNKFKKFYVVTARCINCKVVQDIKVPKGETVKAYFDSERGRCENCGTASLEAYTKPPRDDDDRRDRREGREDRNKVRGIWE